MSVAYDSTGKFIVGDAFEGMSWASGPFRFNGDGQTWIDPTASTSVTAIGVQHFNQDITQFPTAAMRSQTIHYNAAAQGDEPDLQSVTFTVVNTWIAPVYFAGDVVQDILDLLANPPA